jgi:hypothetical protein
MTLFGNRDFDTPRNEAAVHPIRAGGSAFAVTPPVPGSRPAGHESRRVLLRIHGGDDLVVGVADSRDSGVRLARETMRLIDDAESRGEWPELDERFIRPGSIVSIDVQRVA